MDLTRCSTDFHTTLAVSRRKLLSLTTMAPVHTMPTGKYPAKQHVKKVVAEMKSQVSNLTGVLYLEGQKSKLLEVLPQVEAEDE